MVKEIESIDVVYVSFYGNPANNDAFDKLEAIVPLQGNKFFGVYFPQTFEYRACAQITDKLLFSQYNLPVMTIPGGKYAYDRLEGPYEEIVIKIPEVFEKLRELNKEDITRPTVEYYKRHTEFVLMLPIY